MRLQLCQTGSAAFSVAMFSRLMQAVFLRQIVQYMTIE